MNVEALWDISHLIVSGETRYKIADALSSVSQALQLLTANPADQNAQNQLSNSLAELRRACKSSEYNLSPSERYRLQELGCLHLFSEDLASVVRDLIRANAMSPSVARASLEEKISERREVVEHFSALKKSVKFFELEGSYVAEDEVGVGFEIPRDLFDDGFREFQDELKTLAFVIDSFALVQTGKPAEMKLGQLSTTDPLVFMLLEPEVAAPVAAAITWLVHLWKKIEEIRKVRAETARLKLDSATEKVDQEIDSRIRSEIEQYVTQIVSSVNETVAKDTENRLRKSLDLLLQRIERGLTVHLMIAPQSDEGSSEEEEGQASASEENDRSSALNELRETERSLIFPARGERPFLLLQQAPNISKRTE